MGEDLIDNPQLHRPCSKELRPQLEDDLAHHIHNVFSLYSRYLLYFYVLDYDRGKGMKIV